MFRCFGFFRKRPPRPSSLRASLVREEVGGVEEIDVEETSKREIGLEGDDVDDVVVGAPCPTSTSTPPSLLSPLEKRNEHHSRVRGHRLGHDGECSGIPFVRVDASTRGKGTISSGSAPSPLSLSRLLGIAERDAKILLPPLSAADAPAASAFFVRRRRRGRRGGEGGEETELVFLVALEGVRLAIEPSSALVFCAPARPRGALDGVYPGRGRELLDSPLVAALSDDAAAASLSSSSPSFAELALEASLEAVCAALEERAGALEVEAAEAGDRLLASVGGGSGRGGRRRRRRRASPTTEAGGARAASDGDPPPVVPTTREALEDVRRVKGEISELKAAAARVSGALAPRRRRRRALAAPSPPSSGGRARGERRRGRLPRPPSAAGALTWWEEAAEAAAARAGAAAASAAASGEGARGAEAAVRLSLRRLGTMGLFV